MGKIIAFLCLILMLGSVFSVNAMEESYLTKEESTIAKEHLDTSMEKVIEENKAKGAIAVLIQNGEVVLNKGYGYADEFLGTFADGSNSGFRIGSISKTFVAVAALIAYQEGKLDLHKDISIYLEEDFPSLTYPVTMHHLLTHTAGFEEIITGIAVKNVSQTEPLNITVRKYMPKQMARPGTMVSYSNYGIALAAYVIEKATGIDFAEYCMDKIFIPLDMRKTTFAYMHDKVVVSKAYLPNGEETIEPYINLYPEGSAVSTAEDMGKYIKWLLDESDDILTKDNKAKLFSRQYGMAEELGGIGYVWNRKIRNNQMYFDKKGETLNFYSRIVLYPKNCSGLFISFNTYVPEREINRITAEVTDILVGKKTVNAAETLGDTEIKGCYANMWSSFKTPEKILRFFIPMKIVEIDGSLSDGYTINGEKMIHIGNNTYDTPFGMVKFMKQDSKLIMATDFSQTYVKISGLENKPVTLGICILFVLSLLSFLVQILVCRLRKKGISALLSIASSIQLISLLVMALLILKGIMEYALLNYVIYINICAWLIAASTVTHLLHMVSETVKKRKTCISKFQYFHIAISSIFCLVLFNLNMF